MLPFLLLLLQHHLLHLQHPELLALPTLQKEHLLLQVMLLPFLLLLLQHRELRALSVFRSAHLPFHLLLLQPHELLALPTLHEEHRTSLPQAARISSRSRRRPFGHGRWERRARTR